MGQLDYIYLIYGLGFILLATVCLAFGKHSRHSLPWVWLGLFGVFGGLTELVHLVSFLVGRPSGFDAAGILVMAATLFFLLLFAYTSHGALFVRKLHYWTILALTAAPSVACIYGLNAVNIAYRCSLGLLGGAWAGFVIIIASRRTDCRGARVGLLTAGLSIVAYALSMGLVPTNRILTPVPIQAIRALLIVISSAGIWCAIGFCGRPARRTLAIVLTTMVIVVISTGWILVQQSERSMRNQIDDHIYTECRLAASSIDPAMVEGLGNLTDLRDSRYQRLRLRLSEMRVRNPQLRWIYLMTVGHDGRIYFTADSEPLTSPQYSSPGDEYFDAPSGLRALFRGETSAATCEYSDRWGNWLSAYVPIYDDTTHKIIAVLGTDRELQPIKVALRRSHLQPMAITMLTLIILLSFGVVYSRQMDTLELITASQAALRESEEKFRLISSSAYDAIIMLDSNGNISFWNEAATRIFGYTADEIIGKSCHKMLAPEHSQEAAMQAFEAFQGTGESGVAGKTVELSAVKKDGTEFQMAISLSATRIRDEWISIGVLRDITEQKLAEQRLMDEKRLSETLIDSVPGSFCLLDRNGKALWWNKWYDDILGNPETTTDEHHPLRAVVAEDHDLAVAALNEVFLNGRVEVELRFAHGDGSVHWYMCTGALLEMTGEYAALVYGTDITERKAADQKLLEEKRLSETIVGSLPGVFCMIDRRGKAVWWNREYEELIAVDESREGRLPITAIYEEDRELAVDTIRQVFETGHGSIELRFWHTDGILHYGYCTAVRVDMGGEAYGLIFCLNITERKAFEQEIVFKNRLLSIQQEASLDGIIVVDADRRVVFHNQRYLELYGLTDETVHGCCSGLAEAIAANYPVPCRVRDAIERLIEHEYEIERTEADLSDGRTLESYSAPMFGPDGTYLGRAWYVRDITDRKEAEAQVRLHSAAMNAANDLIAIVDPNGTIVSANEALKRQTGYSQEEVVGRHLALLWPQQLNGQYLDRIWAAVKAGHAWNGEMLCMARDNTSYTADVSITPLPSEHGRIKHLVAIARNISDKKAYEDQLDYQAHHDALTGLPNRLAFSDRLEEMVSDRRNRHDHCAVLFIDLDRFKLVNDTMGHHAGDALLVDVASRLASCLREDDVLARMGGDEFTVLLRHIQSPEQAGAVAYRMLEHVSQPFVICDNRLVIGASIGISLYPENARNVVGLLKSADAAMYRAKELGRNNCQFYSEELSQINIARVEMEHDLRQALKHDEFKVYYQPLMDAKTLRLIGAEALMRWDHPEKGMISPGLFIPVAEETGMILQMGKMVLDASCRQCKRWHDLGFEDLEIAVNVSPTQLRNSRFIDEVLGAIRSSNLPMSSLKLEITETALAKNEYDEVDILSELKEMGICICLDDFGIGYSSLSRLKELPIAHMKVDGSFIRDIDHSSKDKAMTESIIAMAHNLGIKVTAEWIEDEEQLKTIQAMHCDDVQGYLVSPALAPEAFEAFLRSWPERQAIIRKAA